MSSVIARTYTNPDNYTLSDADLIEVADGVAKLKPYDLPDQDFTEDFSDDTGFTYNSDEVEFGPGDDVSCYATYTTGINLDNGFGVLTGTASGTPPASVENGELVLTANQVQPVTYSGLRNFEGIHQGAIRIGVKPNYNGNPASVRTFIDIGNGINANNRITIYHTDAGVLIALLYDNAGAEIRRLQGAWSPTLGIRYEIEYNYDITNSKAYLLIDGVILASSTSLTGTRGNSLDYVRIGSSIQTAQSSNFSITEFILFEKIQHTADYTPTAFVPKQIMRQRVETVEASAILPEMEYTGVGTLQALQEIAATLSAGVRFTLQIGRSGVYLYYNAGWVASDGSHAQATSLADFNTHADELDIGDEVYGQFKVHFPNSAIRDYVETLTATVTGQQYSTANPWIMFNETTHASEITAFEADHTGTVKFSIEIDGSDFYITGGALAASSGYAQSNTAAETDDDVDLFLTSRSAFRFKAYLNSPDGSTTPELNYIMINYDASLPDVSPTMIDVNGFIYTGNAGANLTEIKIRPYLKGFINEGVFYHYKWDTIATCDSDGFFSGNIPKNPTGTFWEIKFGASKTYKLDISGITSTSIDIIDQILNVIES